MGFEELLGREGFAATSKAGEVDELDGAGLDDVHLAVELDDFVFWG